MIKAFGTTLTVAAALALGAGAEAHATPSHQAQSVHSGKTHHRHFKAHAACRRARRHAGHRRCVESQHTHVRRHHSRTRQPQARPAVVSLPPLNVSDVTASSAQVGWNTVPGAASARIWVNSHLIDEIPATDPGSYQVQQLWPNTSFAITVALRSPAGHVLVRYRSVVATAPQSGSFPRLFSPQTFINTPVGASPALDPNSTAMVAQALSNYSSSANLVDSNSWGIPVFAASAQSSSYDVGCEYYDCSYQFGPVHIPSDAQPNWGSDGHMVVIQPNGQEMDMWIAQHTASGWTSGERWETSAYGSAANCDRVHGCGSADVAGFALSAGLVRPEEIAQGHIDHALAITTPDTRANYIACPATNTDGQHNDPSALPIGAHVQLNPSINVAKLNLPRWQKVIAVALQQYGAYVIDTGGSIGIYAESGLDRPYDAWAKAGVPADGPSLAGLPWQSMRVLNISQCGS